MKLYPKQYLISSQHKINTENALISEWNHLHIAIHPEDTDKLITGDHFLFFGEVFDFEHSEKNSPEIISQLDFSHSLQDITIQMEKWSGYFILLVKQNNQYFLLNDASSQLEYYFTNDSSEINLAQQPHLLYKLLGEKYSEISTEVPPSVVDTKRNLFSKTIYKRISKLIPNHYYDFQTQNFIRFYPYKTIESKNTNDCIEEVIRVLQNTLLALHKRKPVVSALTSGWDSRVLLACNKENLDKTEFFTIDKVHSYSDIDVRIAKEILQRFHKKQTIFEYNKDANNYFPQEAVFVHDRASELIAENYYKTHLKEKYLINGNISEVGRFYYRPLPKNLSPKDLAYIVKCEQDEYHIPVFKAWQDDFKPFTRMGYDELDFLYWEHRISNWLGAQKSIYNVYTTIVSPFNNRYLLHTLFSMDKKYRDSRFPKYYRIILEKLVPELGDIPINPTESIKKIKLSKALGLYPVTKALRLKFRKLY